MMMRSASAGLVFALLAGGCATVTPEPDRVATVSPDTAQAAQTAAFTPAAPTLKRKVAVGRFSNSTRYGRSLLLEGESDPLADQAADMLVARLVETGRFLVFERRDLEAVADERLRLGEAELVDLVGVDALIMGSVTEFGRRTDGKAGFLSSTSRQTVAATVEARLVEPRSGLAFFSASGVGEAATEAGEVAGFGSRAAYDATLNDRAIAAAISDLVNEIVRDLSGRRWSTDILQVDADRILISGGSRQGLKVGDRFAVETAGEVVTSGQTGLPITLPGRRIAEIEVASFFGDDEFTEGSVARLVSGALPSEGVRDLTVVEIDR